MPLLLLAPDPPLAASGEGGPPEPCPFPSPRSSPSISPGTLGRAPCSYWPPPSPPNCRRPRTFRSKPMQPAAPPHRAVPPRAWNRAGVPWIVVTVAVPPPPPAEPPRTISSPADLPLHLRPWRELPGEPTHLPGPLAFPLSLSVLLAPCTTARRRQPSPPAYVR